MPDPVVSIVGENQPPSGPSEAISIDFGALKAQAFEMLEKAENPDPITPEPAVAAPVAKEADPKEVRVKGASEGQVENPTVEASAAAALDLKDDQLVKVVVDGEEQTLPWKDAKGKISGGLKFTKSMQQLAQEKKDFEGGKERLSVLETEREQMRAFLANGEAVLQLVKTRYPQLLSGQTPQAEQAVPGFDDPNEIATVGQAQSIAKKQIEALQSIIDETKSSVRNQINEATQAIDFERQKQAHGLAISSTLHEVFTANPVLKAIPNIEDIIRYNVALTHPTTEKEALDAFRTVSQGIVEQLGQHFTASKKIQAVAKAKEKLESKSIEPASGSAPQIQPSSFKNPDGSVNWKMVQKQAQDAL